MNTILPSISTLPRNSKRLLMYVSIAGITMGVEELIESVVFSCPCQGHFAYAMSFLYIPALVLLLPGILLDRARYGPLHDKDNTKYIFLAVSKYSTLRWRYFSEQPSLPRHGWFCLSYSRSTIHVRSLACLWRVKAQSIIPLKNATSNLDGGRESWRKSIKGAVKMRAGL